MFLRMVLRKMLGHNGDETKDCIKFVYSEMLPDAFSRLKVIKTMQLRENRKERHARGVAETTNPCRVSSGDMEKCKLTSVFTG
jgi:hypothetical protein